MKCDRAARSVLSKLPRYTTSSLTRWLLKPRQRMAMGKALWAIIAGVNPGSWAIIALIVIGVLGAASGTGAYFMHRLDAAAYTKLQLKYANAEKKAKDDRIAADKKFEAAKEAADARITELVVQLQNERGQHAQELHDAIAAEGAKNVPFNMCMRTKLPSSILSKLPR